MAMATWTRGRILGQGNYGFVSLAHNWDSTRIHDDHNLPPIFAVKSAEFSRSYSLQKEREILYQFQDSQYIIRCYGGDSSEINGVIHYDLMSEFAQESLSDRIYGSTHSLLEEEVKRHTKSVLLGLNHIHRKGFVHCDIKQNNILLVDDGEGMSTAKISDFGLAVRRKQRIRKKGFRGTPLYMAPESIINGEYDSVSDIWALGCTVIEMFTKKPAWDFDDCIELGELLERISNEEVEIPYGLSKDADDFLKKCLIKNPELRWTADMLLEHPFVSCLDKASVISEIPEETSISMSSTRSSVVKDESIVTDSFLDLSNNDIDDLIKPRLLMNAPKVAEDPSVPGKGLVLKPAMTNSVSEKYHEKFPLCMRRKRVDHQVQQEASKCNVNFGPACLIVGA